MNCLYCKFFCTQRTNNPTHIHVYIYFENCVNFTLPFFAFDILIRTMPRCDWQFSTNSPGLTTVAPFSRCRCRGHPLRLALRWIYDVNRKLLKALSISTIGIFYVSSFILSSFYVWHINVLDQIVKLNTLNNVSNTYGKYLTAASFFLMKIWW